MNPLIEKKLIGIVGEDFVLSNYDQIQAYLLDETEEMVRPDPDEDCIVVKPGNDKEVSEILKIANEMLFPVIPRGGGTGATGAAIPDRPSVIMSMERFNKIIEVDEDNMMIRVETGVTLAQMNEYLLKNHNKLHFPIHPGDESAHLGGMVIENAGGAKAIRHGIMRNHIKGLKVVYPTGEIGVLGGKILKNNMGYDISHILIGSEGTLAVLTEVTLKLYSNQGKSATMVVSFNNGEDAIKAAAEFQSAGIIPLAIEYMERELSIETARHMSMVWPANNEGKIDLMIVIEDINEDVLFMQAEEIVGICEKNGAVDTILADNPKDEKTILDIRSNIYTAYKEIFVDSLDTCVPPQTAGKVVKEFHAAAAEFNTICPIFGHVGDGNFHNFILRVDGEVPAYVDDLRKRYYEIALKYGGTISAEHGTGKTRKKYMSLQFNEFEIQLMRNIKKAFDPNWILNPGTILD